MAQLQQQNQAGNWQARAFAVLTEVPTDTFRINAIDGPGFLGGFEIPGRGTAYKMRVTFTAPAEATLEVHNDVGQGVQNPYIGEPPQFGGEVKEYALAGEKYVGFTVRSFLSGTPGLEILVEFFE